MSFKIVTESTADLPAEVKKDFDIQVIPEYINIGSRCYLDGVQIARSEFSQNLAENLGRKEQLALVHHQTFKKDKNLKKVVLRLIPEKSPVWKEEVKPLIGVQVGLGAIGIVCMASK